LSGYGKAAAAAWNELRNLPFSGGKPTGHRQPSVTQPILDQPRRDRAHGERGQTADAEAASRRRHKLLFIGLFPPPVNGQRVVTQCMLERLSAIAEVTFYNTDRFRRLGPLSKPLSTLVACVILIKARLSGCTTLYLAPHSGAGLIYSSLVALVSRCCGYALAVHYHSYRNLGRYTRLMGAFLAICGPAALHVVLAPPMARDLRRLYRSARHVTVVSNTTFVAPRPIERSFGARRLRIGHLSNLSRKKGIGMVLDCLRELRDRGVEVELWLAGPAEDSETGMLIAEAQTRFGSHIRYLGRLDAMDVPRFYRDIDVFLFPTAYEHEAEPLVIVDAVSAGVPVIATDRGCIAYLLGITGGRVLAAEDFMAETVEQIAAWASDPRQLAEASAQTQARFAELHGRSRRQLDGVLTAIVNGRNEAVGAKSAEWEPPAHPNPH
jgi:glycosyltransferase involved in cell wall biosynthesis